MNDKEKNRKKKLHDRYKEGYDKNELVGERTDGRKGDGREENYRGGGGIAVGRRKNTRIENTR